MSYIADTCLRVCIISDMNAAILHRLAGEIKSMRMQRGLSQLQLADAAGVNRKTIIELEKGSTGIALGTVVAVLESMGGELAVKPVSKPTTSEVQALLGLGQARASLERFDGKGRGVTSAASIGSLHYSPLGNSLTKLAIPSLYDQMAQSVTTLAPKDTLPISTLGSKLSFASPSMVDTLGQRLTTLVPQGTLPISTLGSNLSFGSPSLVDTLAQGRTTLAPQGVLQSSTAGSGLKKPSKPGKTPGGK